MNTPTTRLTLPVTPHLKPGDWGSHFWSRVDQTGGPDACWPWTAARFDTGYGCVWADGKARKAHRVAWGLMNGEIPEGVRILHRCDTPICCNPGHLFAGTSRDNTADMDAKGRRAGSYRKLHPEAVADIRVSRRAGVTLQALADRYGCTAVAIHLAAVGKTWRHLPGAVR